MKCRKCKTTIDKNRTIFGYCFECAVDMGAVLFKKYWKELSQIEDSYYDKIRTLEEKMEKETGIEGIEFFWCDNEIVGIGDCGRSMKLIHRG